MRKIGGGASAVFLAAALGWSCVLAGMSGTAFGWDVRGFYVPGSDFPHPPEMAGAPGPKGPGYDGQFFAALTIDPLLLRPETPGRLDMPSYRAGRIGLPLAAWIVVLGNRPAALHAYLILAWLLGLLGVWVAARWLEEEGRSPWEALPLALSLGLVVTMTRGMPDAAAASLLLLAIWREVRGRSGAVALLVAASLVRETSLVGVVALAVVRWRQGRRWGAAAAAVVPGAALLGWRAWVFSRPGVQGVGVLNLGVPLVWAPAKLSAPWTIDSIPETVALAALALAVVALIAMLPRWRSFGLAAWTYAGIVLLVLMVGEPIYADRWAFGRVTCALPMLAVPLAAMEARPVVARLLRAVPHAYALAGVIALLFLTRLPAELARLIGA